MIKYINVCINIGHMNQIKVTNLVKFYTLLFLYKSPMHGYELIKQLQLCTGKKISASHVYPFLKTLEKKKIIVLKSKGERDKKQYCLTKKGRIFTKNLIDRLSGLVNFNQKTCVNCGCKLIEGAYKKEINKETVYFCCKYCAKNYKI